MTRFLLVSGIALLGLVLIWGCGTLLLVHGLTRADPYPAFMRDYEQGSRSTYQEAERTFSEFVVKTFPTGSNAKDAIAQASGGGFRPTTSTSHSVELVWMRRAGPCHEDYYLIIDQTADGTIANITGRLHAICL
jgi:hypothetical protein